MFRPHHFNEWDPKGLLVLRGLYPYNQQRIHHKKHPKQVHPPH